MTANRTQTDSGWKQRSSLFFRERAGMHNVVIAHDHGTLFPYKAMCLRSRTLSIARHFLDGASAIALIDSSLEMSRCFFASLAASGENLKGGHKKDGEKR